MGLPQRRVGVDLLEVKYQYSDIGHRDENLDRFGHIKKDLWSFSYVIDGFVINSPHYVDSLKQQLDNLNNLPSNSTEKQIIEAISSAISFDHKHSGKASVAIVVCLPNKMITLTAGDTRVYLLTSLKRTTDHSQAQKMIDLGRSKASSLYQHPLRKYLIKKLEPGCNIDELTRNEHHSIENIMLCSDGVWSCFNSDEDLYQCVSKGHDAFTEQALLKRSVNRDNMTILWLEISES